MIVFYQNHSNCQFPKSKIVNKCNKYIENIYLIRNFLIQKYFLKISGENLEIGKNIIKRI